MKCQDTISEGKRERVALYKFVHCHNMTFVLKLIELQTHLSFFSTPLAATSQYIYAKRLHTLGIEHTDTRTSRTPYKYTESI